MAKRIDSHNHIDIWSDDDGRLARIRQHAIGVIAWAWLPEAPADEDGILAYLERQRSQCDRRREEGISLWRMVGVHPRSIPLAYGDAPPRPDRVAALFEPFLAGGDVVGVGEIGLETGSPTEACVFESQLALALASERPCGIHTPRRNKQRIFEQIVSILGRHDLAHARLVIDHVTSLDMLDAVLALGCHAGITISPSKASPELARELVTARSADQARIMLNSDSGLTDTADDYDLFLGIDASMEANAVPLGETARRFFGLAEI